MSNISKAFSQTPKPAYYACIFTSQRTEGDNGYSKMAERMDQLAKTQVGYLGIESVRAADGFGITVSYWESEEAIRNWKAQAEHLIAQETGIRHWYEHYELRVAKVERAYSKQPQPEAAQNGDKSAIVWGGK
jgi:heme-degrading monooxygenase HmoA